MKLSNSEQNIKKALDDENYSYALEEATVQSNCGSVYATYVLGLCAQYGYGTTPNIQLAVDYYERASKCDNDEAAYELGKLLLEGVAIKKDIDRAISLLEMAAKQNHVGALKVLGQYYESIDVEKAVEHYQKAERVSISIETSDIVEANINKDPSIIKAEDAFVVLDEHQLEIDGKGYIIKYNEERYNYNVILPLVNGISSFTFSKKTQLRKLLIIKCEAIGYSAFSTCELLQEINFSDPQNIKVLGSRAFADCKNLENIFMPNTIRHMGYGCFSGCTNLRYVKFSSGMDGVRLGTFNGCYSLEEIILPEKFATSNYNAIGGNAFHGCNKLRHISFPTNLRLIDEKAFENCAGLRQVILPNSLEEIGASAFYNCSSLEKVIIPKNVSKIGIDAFAMCKSLKKITIPKIFKSKMKKIFGKDLFPKGSPKNGLEVAYI